MKAVADMAKRIIRTPAEVGAAIRARRRALGWGQAELADRMGVSRLWIYEVEGGKPGAKIGLVLRAFAALGLTLTFAEPGQLEGDGTPAPAKAIDLGEILDAARRKPTP
jgi:HTH-type transcriptional regulator/antitoxin HipB